MKCPRCQQDNPTEQKFCGDCGTPLPSPRASAQPAPSHQPTTSAVLPATTSSASDVQPVLSAIAHTAARLCEGGDALIYVADRDRHRLIAKYGRVPQPQRLGDSHPIRRDTPLGLAVLDRRPVHVRDIRTDLHGRFSGLQDVRILVSRVRTVLAMPLLREGVVLGGIVIRRTRVQPFTAKQVALLKTFADQAAIAIENVQLFTELQDKNRALTAAHAQVTEALDQQTATSEILKVIAASPTDLQPVLDALVESASRLCQAADTALLLVEGDQLGVVASHGYAEAGAIVFSNPIQRGWVAGRAVVDAQTVHVEDLANAKADFPLGQEIAVRFGHRTALATPLLREGTPIGTLFLRRKQVRRFSDKEITLLQTFADQAVIAIENVRLFKELQEKNRALAQAHAQVSESLEQQTATTEILRVISSSPTNVQPVFEAIGESAVRLMGAAMASVYEFDGTLVHLRTLTPPTWRHAEELRRQYPKPPDAKLAAGRVILERAILHLADLQTDPGTPSVTRQIAERMRLKGVLWVPMLRAGTPIGVIGAVRAEAGLFSDKQVRLLQTFADQAVIAIENVRLFNELEVANRDLKAASQHKSEFLANMSHELRTPLNAIIGFSEVLGERLFGDLNAKQDEYLKDIHASGQHLLSLINDILDLSKIEAGRMELEVTDFDLPLAIDNALTLVRERAARRSIALHTTVDERLGQVQGDERKIRQVLLNLLSNAIKFTPEGGRIEVRAKHVDGSAEIVVTDTGVGIAPEDQEAIFEEFRQVGTADKKVEGTGLGLALSRKFIELHGGNIWVRSQIGDGSTFTFRVPVRRGE
jgi:signal transduction histidine kinase/putative methionine-R-sulfoxide reductase with GAF domain